MSDRTRRCNITPKVRKEVKERDCDCCIFCGSTYGVQICHIVPRSRGGLGIPQNLVCGCISCHAKMDQSTQRQAMLDRAQEYLQSIYPDFDDTSKVYQKWGGLFSAC